MSWRRHLLAAPVIAMTAAATPAQAAVNAEAEVSAAMFAASATQAAFQKSADAKLRAERERIVALRAELKQQKAGAAAATAERRDAEARLAAAERDFVAQLAAKDRAFAEEIAVFRSQVTDIAATAEGAQALAMFNEGDELGAIAILKRLRAANDAARQKRSDIESAAEGRRIATLELEARARGKLGTAAVIASFEEVVAKDPGVFSDWVELGNLYLEQRQFAAARSAVDNGVTVARRLALASPSDLEAQHDLSESLENLAQFELRVGNFAAARAASAECLDIARRAADANPGNTLAQNVFQRYLFDLAYSKTAGVNWAQILSELEGRSARGILHDPDLRLLEHARGEARAEAVNEAMRNDLSVTLNEHGEVAVLAGNEEAALAALAASLPSRRLLAAANPANAEAQRDLWVTLYKLASLSAYLGSYVTKWAQVVAEMESQQARGILVEADLPLLEGARASLAREVAGFRPEFTYSSKRMSEAEVIEFEMAIEVDAMQKASFQEFENRRRLAAADPANAGAQRDLWVAMANLATLACSGVTWSQVLAEMETQVKRGILPASDHDYLEEVRDNAAKDQGCAN